jgi:hypothetical protein
MTVLILLCRADVVRFGSLKILPIISSPLVWFLLPRREKWPSEARSMRGI